MSRDHAPDVVFAAFDPGLSGAVAIWREGRMSATMVVYDLPTMGVGASTVLNAAALAGILQEAQVTHAIVEHVHSMPKQGVASTFKFGTAFGQILGVLGALQIPHELVSPVRWKRDMRLSGGGADKKEQARQRAIELMPHMACDLARKRDHNRAEALLLAVWKMKRGRN